MTPTYEELKAENERLKDIGTTSHTLYEVESENAKLQAHNLSLVAALKEIRERTRLNFLN